MRHPAIILAVAPLLQGVAGANFPFEEIQLTEESAVARMNRTLAFGQFQEQPVPRAACRAFPGTANWPPDAEWGRLRAAMDGALLKPAPPAAVCYEGEHEDRTRCRWLLTENDETRFYTDDPVTVLTEWTQGTTCPLELNPRGPCTQGGFPEYVVNVSTVAHVQMAVNFARNKNLRLVIKNTGHSFLGRSAGAGSLSIWTHYLKQFEFIPEYTLGGYTGMAARVGAGLEAWELYDYMAEHKTTIVVPAGYTVGPYGGWIAGGGHSNLCGYYGMGVDQVLSLQVVTASGEFVTADPFQNSDLFYALRGGGGSTYGVVTSAIVKAHPAVTITTSKFNLTTNGLDDLEPFWNSVYEFYRVSYNITNMKGATYSDVSPNGDGSYTFTADIELINTTPEAMYDMLKPLYDYMIDQGINTTQPIPAPSTRFSAMDRGVGDKPGNSHFATRLFPTDNFADPQLFQKTMAAMREIVEAGYLFHALNFEPNESVAGWPSSEVDSGLNPAWRRAAMHADVFDKVPDKAPARVVRDAHDRLDGYMDILRALTPGSGAYANEADVLEPNFQQSFWGDKYETLLGIKKARDPWGLFYAPATVGSEAWVVEGSEGLPNQNGRLCRA